MAYYKHSQVEWAIPFREDCGVYPIDINVELAAAQVENDGAFINIGRFGPNTYIAQDTDWDFDFDDLDSDGAPALVVDVQVADELDGTGNVDTLISGSTAGQTGATDAFDGDENLTDVSGKYLQLKVTTVAATGAAGGLRIKGYIASDLNVQSFDLTGSSALT